MSKLKALMEKRAEYQAVMEELLDLAEQEKRAMTDEENSRFDEAENEIRAIDETIEREERARNIQKQKASSSEEERATEEEKAFADYVLGRVSELRAGEQNMTMANNGAIIPTTIANRIIK